MVKRCLPPLLPIKPNTPIKTKGKIMLKTTVEGLRIIDLKLAFVMANMAFIWL
jgi:hypothetical protein